MSKVVTTADAFNLAAESYRRGQVDMVLSMKETAEQMADINGPGLTAYLLDIFDRSLRVAEMPVAEMPVKEKP